MRRTVAAALLLAACNGPAGPSTTPPPTTPDGPDTTSSAPTTSWPEATLPTGEALGEGRVAFDSDRTGSFEIFTMTADGSEVRQLTDDPETDAWWPRLSPDRTTLLFYRTPAGVHDTDFTRTSLWAMVPDGSGQVELLPPGTHGWDQHGHVEWAPDGGSLVMFGGSRTNPQIFITDPDGSRPRPVTERGGTNIDPSFSVDGSTVYFVGCPQSFCLPSGYEVYAIPDQGGEATRLVTDDLRDHDPYMSPDGGTIAWLTMTSTDGPAGAWGIRLMDPDGSNQRWVIDDGNINSKPEWAPDGSLIWFHRLVYGEDEAFSVYTIRPDGSGLTEVTADQPGVNEFPDA